MSTDDQKGSFIDPNKEQVALLKQSIKDSAAEIEDAVQAIGRYGVQPDDISMLGLRIEHLLNFLMPTEYDGDGMPTNVERLMFEDTWHLRVVALVTAMKEQVEEQQRKATLIVPNQPPPGIAGLNLNGRRG